MPYILFLFISVKAFAETEDPKATGEFVVNAVLSRFNETGFETNENVLTFMRRLAWVESRFGNDPHTFRQGFHGGIWQEDLGAFRETQNARNNPTLVDKHSRINVIFGIDWINIPWNESRKPLYSAITARLHLGLSPTQIPLNGIEQQARF